MPSEKMFHILARKTIGDIGDPGNNMRMRVTHRFKIRLMIGLIWTVTEAYESHPKSLISPIAFRPKI